MTTKQILESIKELTAVQLTELSVLMKEEFKLNDTTSLDESTSESAEEKEKTGSVFITDIGSNKIAAMKTIKNVLECSLQEAKAVVENLSKPLVDNQSIEVCNVFIAKFTEEGIDYKELKFEIK